MEYDIVAGLLFLFFVALLIRRSAWQHKRRSEEYTKEFNAMLQWNDRKDRLLEERGEEAKPTILLVGDEDPQLRERDKVVPLDQKRRKSLRTAS